MTNNSIVIESHNLSKSLPVSTSENLQILDQINLSVQQGESVAITGASGSGENNFVGVAGGFGRAEYG